MPPAADATAAGAGVAGGRGSCEISMVDPDGANLAGSAAVVRLIASLTGMPLSRSCDGADVVGDAALAFASVPDV